MKKVVSYSPAKINLTLDIINKEKKFHNISSLVASINLYDKIILKKRKDTVITLKEKGIKSGASITENTAYRSAKLFLEKYSTCGVDIIINKKIPVANGLGGSSSNIAGVLNGLKNLFNITEDITPLASQLGSDSVYMLNGGFAVMSGRGEKVENLNLNLKLPLLLIFGKEQVLAKDSYAKYDTLSLEYKDSTTNAVKFLQEGNLEEFYKVVKNDLYESSKLLCPNIELAMKKMQQSGAKSVLMSGSGSCVYGIFNDFKARDLAYKKLKKEYHKQLYKAETI